MLVHRNCRLGTTYPEIYETQACAIFEAALDMAEASGEATFPELMIPLVANSRELGLVKAVVDRVPIARLAAADAALNANRCPSHATTSRFSPLEPRRAT